jgi:hypothetical protein
MQHHIRTIRLTKDPMCQCNTKEKHRSHEFAVHHIHIVNDPSPACNDLPPGLQGRTRLCPHTAEMLSSV